MGAPEAAETSSCSRCCCGTSWRYQSSCGPGLANGRWQHNLVSRRGKRGCVSETRRSPSSFSAAHSVRCTRRLLTQPSEGKPDFSASLHKSGFTHPHREQNWPPELLGPVRGSPPDPHWVAACRVHPPLFGRYFGFSFGICCQPRGRGQPQNMWGLLVLPRALKEKVNSY